MAKEYQFPEERIEDFTLLDPEVSYSYADYLSWAFEERVEIIKGKIFKMSAGQLTRHQLISTNLISHIGPHIRNKPCKLFHAPFDVRLPNQPGDDDKKIFTVAQPDICIVCDASKLDEKGCIGAPDLIIEILSPLTASRDLKDKFELYREHKVNEYWLVFPNDNIVEIFLLNPEGHYLSAARLSGSDHVPCGMLSAINLTVGDIFE
ncbi:Uma2 family endonuclease [uncultured Imperialibacter sp.]|uniref:Uma2 family endonuclease n=1 Tax=uncultured Imperialibacter sp. TaxID=1672639 RepID=UPI0030DCC9B5|tara:strand:+ start:2322 stop:2939 length:618 start_codon:yes stop_codon:yes gene_type:complete